MEHRTSQDIRSLSEIRDRIRKEDEFVITTHINPDGDSIASVLLVAALLRHFGKRYRILLDDDVPGKFDFLATVEEIQCYDGGVQQKDARVLFVVDATSLDRIGSVRGMISENAEIINIDHHTSNLRFGAIDFIKEEESSTAEVVYELLSFLEVPITPEIATIVYTGVICDTGRFLFPNTNLRSLSVCTEMVERGAVADEIAKKIYCRTSQGTIRALSAALATLEFHFDGVVSCMVLENGCVQSEAKIDTEGFVDHLLSIEGTEVEFFMCEKAPNCFRVSFRSKRYVDVNQVAARFGGGGHKRASGCTVEGSVGEVKAHILAVVKEFL